MALMGGGQAALAQDAGSRYAQIVADAKVMANYNAQMERNLQSQQVKLVEIQQQLAELDATAAAIGPLLNKMFQQFDSFVTTDLPFIDPSQASPDHRAERLAKLRDLMEDQTATPGAKLHRLLEALQIEIEYGRTMASYKGKLADGREVFFVRMGRVSLMYRTVDGEETGYWDALKKSWVVDNDYSDAVNTALQIATKAKAPDLTEVPVPAPQGKSYSQLP